MSNKLRYGRAVGLVGSGGGGRVDGGSAKIWGPPGGLEGIGGGGQLISAPPAEEICGINAAWTAAGCVSAVLR